MRAGARPQSEEERQRAASTAGRVWRIIGLQIKSFRESAWGSHSPWAAWILLAGKSPALDWSPSFPAVPTPLTPLERIIQECRLASCLPMSRTLILSHLKPPLLSRTLSLPSLKPPVPVLLSLSIWLTLHEIEHESSDSQSLPCQLHANSGSEDHPPTDCLPHLWGQPRSGLGPQEDLE